MGGKGKGGKGRKITMITEGATVRKATRNTKDSENERLPENIVTEKEVC